MEGMRVPDPHGRRKIRLQFCCPLCDENYPYYRAEEVLIPATLQDEVSFTFTTRNVPSTGETLILMEMRRVPPISGAHIVLAKWDHTCKGVYR